MSKDGQGIGLMVDGKPLRGFLTPSRRFEVRSLFVERIGKNEDCSELIANSGVKASSRPQQHQGHDVAVDAMPSWFQPQEHQSLAEDLPPVYRDPLQPSYP